MTELTLGQAYELLLCPNQKSNDIPLKFKETYEHFGYKHDDLLTRFVNLIYDEPIAWLNALPDKYKSVSSLAKPKTAVLNLLKKEEVKHAVGEALCTDACNKLDAAFKANKDKISAARMKWNPHAQNDDTISAATDEDGSQTHTAVNHRDIESHSECSDASAMHMMRNEIKLLKNEISFIKELFVKQVTAQSAGNTCMFPCSLDMFKQLLMRKGYAEILSGNDDM